MITLTGSGSGDLFDALQERGQSSFERGSIPEGFALLREAHAYASSLGDRRRADLAFCNLCSAAVGFAGQESLAPEEMARLREILMRNEDGINCRLAAYVLSRAYELRKEARKGLFYARLSLDRAQILERPDWIASSHNQIGNLLIVQSFFDEAAGHYEQALKLHPEQALERRALIEINLAYADLMRGNRRRALSSLYQCLRLARRLGAAREARHAHLDLCFAHLEMGRYRDAVRHGSKGLALAEQLGDIDGLKNALYLLGEASHLMGDSATARLYFARLQAEFYPTSNGITDFLLAVDVRKIINLRA